MQFKKSFIGKIITFVGIAYVSYLYGTLSTNELLYQDSHTVTDEVFVTSSLYRIHPFLAEYDRKVWIWTPKGSWSFDLGIDPGGYPDIRVYRKANSVLIPSIDGTWNSIGINTGRPEAVQSVGDDLEFLGKFTFAKGIRNWSYVQAEEGGFEEPLTFKGG